MVMIGERVNSESKHEPSGSRPIEGDEGILVVHDLNAWYGHTLAIKHIDISIRAQAITAIIESMTASEA